MIKNSTAEKFQYINIKYWIIQNKRKHGEFKKSKTAFYHIRLNVINYMSCNMIFWNDKAYAYNPKLLNVLLNDCYVMHWLRREIIVANKHFFNTSVIKTNICNNTVNENL